MKESAVLEYAVLYCLFGNVLVAVCCRGCAPLQGVARERVPEGFKRSPFGSKSFRKALTRTGGGGGIGAQASACEPPSDFIGSLSLGVIRRDEGSWQQDCYGALAPRRRSLDGFYDGAGRVLARCGRCQELASPGASPAARRAAAAGGRAAAAIQRFLRSSQCGLLLYIVCCYALCAHCQARGPHGGVALKGRAEGLQRKLQALRRGIVARTRSQNPRIR